MASIIQACGRGMCPFTPVRASGVHSARRWLRTCLPLVGREYTRLWPIAMPIDKCGCSFSAPPISSPAVAKGAHHVSKSLPCFSCSSGRPRRWFAWFGYVLLSLWRVSGHVPNCARPPLVSCRFSFVPLIVRSRYPSSCHSLGCWQYQISPLVSWFCRSHPARALSLGGASCLSPSHFQQSPPSWSAVRVLCCPSSLPVWRAPPLFIGSPRLVTLCALVAPLAPMQSHCKPVLFAFMFTQHSIALLKAVFPVQK